MTNFSDNIILYPERYEKIIEQCGRNCQMIKAMEESGELVQALAKYLNKGEGLANLIEEIADNIIMAEQLILMLDCQDEVKHWRDAKYVRTIEKLNTARL